MKNSRQLFTLAAIFVLNLFGILKLDAQTQGIRLKDEVRRMTLFVPEGMDKSTPAALVLSFHGSGTTALEHMFYTEMNELALEKQFIVAYPQGKNNDWNVGFEQDYHSGNDVEFIDSLIHKLKKYYTIKENQIFAVGLSRGGFFAQRLVSELPNTFAAVASVGAPLPNRVAQALPQKLNTGLLLVHGTADEVVTFEGDDGNYLSSEASFNLWKQKLDLFDKPSYSSMNTVNDGTHIEIKSYHSQKSITQLKIINGGHTWPNANDFNIGFPIGLTTHDLDFNSYLWTFFQSNVSNK